MRQVSVLTLAALMLMSCRQTIEVSVLTVGYEGERSQAVKLAQKKGEYFELRIPLEELSGLDSLTIHPSFAQAQPGDDGYFLDPQGMLCYFKEGREEGESVVKRRCPLPIVGTKTPGACYLTIFETYRFNIDYRTEFHGGLYSQYQSLVLKETKATTDFVVRYYPLSGKDADYSGMGRLYRKIKVVGAGLKPLSERAQERPELKYALENPEIRIRQCWKPVPTAIEHQTLENEPEPRVKVTFKRVEDIIDALKAVGVDKSQLTLVGWNIAGHDGRFPTVFPVEPRLGGEQALRHLISKAQADGFQIVPHICTCDSYEVSPDFSWDNVAKRIDGSPSTNYVYGSGRMYDLCYKVAYENFVLPIVDSLLRMGFRGVCYDDVYSVVSPTMCYDEKHPCFGTDTEEYARKTLAECARMGGVASEGGYDHVASVLDFALYVNMFAPGKIWPLRDEYVPIWNIVYNGYIYSCPSSHSINYSIKAPELSMKIQEYGGHPTFYFYSAHRDDSANWMGSRTSDLLCADADELAASAAAVKKGYDYIKEYGDLQYQTMEEHCKLEPGVFRTTYSDGTQTICNYSDSDFTYNGVTVGSKSWHTFR